MVKKKEKQFGTSPSRRQDRLGLQPRQFHQDIFTPSTNAFF